MDPFEPNILRFFIVPHLLATGKANVNAFLQKFLISHLKGTKNAKVKAVLEISVLGSMKKRSLLRLRL